MPKYIIKWSIGFGDSVEVIEAASLDAATTVAYEQAREDFESSASYEAMEYNEENAEEYNIDFEDEEE